MTPVLPKFMAIRSSINPSTACVYYKKDGCIVLGEQDVLSTVVKIEVEPATSNDKYVHLRFCYSNRYWARDSVGNNIVAQLKKPEEDRSMPSCTLFMPVEVAGEKGAFRLIHVRSGAYLCINQTSFSVEVYMNTPRGYLMFIDWETLVKLPARVAFKGDSGAYLKGTTKDRKNYLQFSSHDPNEWSSGHHVSLMPTGHVRISSDHWGGQFWRRSPNWIWADTTDTTASNRDTLFWPVKIDDNTIALRNEGNKFFCKRLTTEGKTSMLNAAVSNITTEARLVVQELVSQRNIYNVRYRMEDARIYNETAYVAGGSVLTNVTNQEAAMAVQITYQDEKSYAFSRTSSLTAGVKTTFKSGVPFIVDGEIKVSSEMNTTLQWNTTTTTTTSIMASGSVPVPARSRAMIEYVGTKGTCDVPYSYTQQDMSSTNGTTAYTHQLDGIYKGVNCYNFHFLVKSTRPMNASVKEECNLL